MGRQSLLSEWRDLESQLIVCMVTLDSTRVGGFSGYWSRLVISGCLKNERLHLGRNRHILSEGVASISDFCQILVSALPTI